MILTKVCKGEMLLLVLSLSQTVTICSAEASVELTSLPEHSWVFSSSSHAGTAIVGNDYILNTTASVLFSCHLQ